jgi:hypothetical protein
MAQGHPELGVDPGLDWQQGAREDGQQEQGEHGNPL